MISSENLRREIDTKLKVISENSMYKIKKDLIIKKNLRRLSNIYSFWLENPDLRTQILPGIGQCEKNRKKVRKIACDGVKRIENAWYYLDCLCKNGNIIEKINEDTVLEVCKIVSPYETEGFRKSNVYLNIKCYCPPNFEKVPEQVRNFCINIKS